MFIVYRPLIEKEIEIFKQKCEKMCNSNLARDSKSAQRLQIKPFPIVTL